jgi:hypothetical protein
MDSPIFFPTIDDTLVNVHPEFTMLDRAPKQLYPIFIVPNQSEIVVFIIVAIGE